MTGETPKANFIKAWRQHRGLGQNALARMTGLTQGLVSAIEIGKNDRPDAIALIAEALGVSVEDLTSRDPTQL